MNPTSLHATCPTCSLELFNQVVLYLYAYILWKRTCRWGARANYLFPQLDISLSFFKKEKKILQRARLSVKSL